MAKKLPSGNASTRGIKLPQKFLPKSRTQVIEHLLMLNLDPDIIEQILINQDPEAKTNDDKKRQIQEAVRKQRCLYLQKLEHNKVLEVNDEAKPLSDINEKEGTTDFIKLSIEEINWVFDGGIPRANLILLAGSPGIGKTRLAIAISSDITRLGGKVHYFQAETTKEKFASWAAGSNPVKERFFVDSSSSIDLLLDKVKKVSSDLVVIDSVDMFKRSFSQSEVRRTNVLLTQVARETKSALLLIHHLNKQGTVKGSNDIEFLVDVCAHAEAPDSDLSLLTKDFVLRIPTKNRCGAAGRSVRFRHNQNGIEPVKSLTLSNLKIVG